MATQGPDSIDAFLRSILGLNLEETAQEPQPAHVSVRVMLARLPNSEYAVHCFVLERGVTETDLEGQLLRGQLTFQAESLARFSETYEKMLEQLEINYHRNPPVPPGPGQDIVSYKLVKKLTDQGGQLLLQVIAEAHYNLYKRHGQVKGD